MSTATVKVVRWVVVVSAAVVLGLVGVHWANASEHRVPLNVVLLGDSYSAGNGAGGGGASYHSVPGCYRSTVNWAERYVAWLDANGYEVSFVNRACSSAVTAHVMNPQVVDNSGIPVSQQGSLWMDAVLPGEWGEGSVLDAELRARWCPRPVDGESVEALVDHLTYDSVNDVTFVTVFCRRTVKAQKEAVDSSTDLVLLTIGGNDAGFSDIVESCFTWWIFSKTACETRMGQAENVAFNTLQPATVSILRELYDRMNPDGGQSGRVVLLSYPYLELGGYTFDNYAAGDEVRRLGDLGDTAAAAAVAQVNSEKGYEFAVFVDTVKERFAGHEPHGSPWRANSNRWIHELGWTPDRIDPLELYHPNDLGHQAYADALIAFPGVIPSQPPARDPDIDLLVVVDTSSSMAAELASLQGFASDFVDLLGNRSRTFRIGLASYRDDPASTGLGGDYSGRLDLSMQYNGGSFASAVTGLSAAGGGGSPNTAFSGILAGVDQGWRQTVKRAVVVVTDAAAYDNEPVSGYTSADVLESVFSVGGTAVYVVDTSSSGGTDPNLVLLANRTGGAVLSAPTAGSIPDVLSDVVDAIVASPYVSPGGPYWAAIGASTALSAQGSYAASGSINSYQWDTNGDGVYEVTSTIPLSQYVFEDDFDGYVVLRVSDSEGRASIASAPVHVSDDGDGVPSGIDNCPFHYNPDQSDFDGDGIGDICDPDPGYSRLFERHVPCLDQCLVASIWGDPHLVTFDGLKYDLQTVGEHVLVESADGSVMVQTRHEPWGSSTRVSVVTALAARVGEVTVGFYAGEGVRIFEELVEVPDGGHLPLPDGAAIFRTGSTYTLAWPGEDESDRFRVDVRLGATNLRANPFLPPHMVGQVSGLLGDGDGDHTNDLARRDGTVLAQPLSKTSLYTTFAGSWRLTQAESLLQYGPGESTQTFTDLTFPKGVVTLASLDPGTRALAEAVCWNAGVTDPILWEACVLDVALTGLSEFAESALGVPIPVAAITDGYFHDFEDGTAPGWSVPLVSWTESGSSRFLGPFSASSNTLTLTGLPPHTQAVVSLDVHVIGGWEGDAGSDALRVVTSEGVEILPTSTFSNTTATQSYPSPGSAARTGAIASDDIGNYGGFGSATYRFEATLNRWQPTMTITVQGSGVSGAAGQVWGVDNVEVHLVRLVPERFDIDPVGTNPTRIPLDISQSGAGNLDVPRAEDHYSFTIEPGYKGIYVIHQSCLSGLRFEILDSEGERVLERACGTFEFGLDNGDYTLATRSSNNSTGNYSFTLYAVPDDLQGEVDAGASTSMWFQVPGQNGYVTFEAEEGDRRSLYISTSGMGIGNMTARVYTPSGQTLWGPNTFTSQFYDTKVMPETGTYTIFLDPRVNKTGSATVSLWEVPEDLEAQVTAGTPLGLSLGTPGLNGYVTFEAEQGDRRSLYISTSGMGIGNMTARVYGPSGQTIWGPHTFTSRFYDTTVMPETGTYTIFLDPRVQSTGSATVSLWEVPEDLEAQVTAGIPLGLSFSTPGLNGYVTFEAQQGDLRSLSISTSGMGIGNMTARVYTPSGQTLWGPHTFTSKSYGVTQMPETGTYTIFLDPRVQHTGNATVTLQAH